MVEFRYQNYGTRIGIYVNEEFIGALLAETLGFEGMDMTAHLIAGLLDELGIDLKEVDA